ncbi:MAG: methyltransferase domain-containing protein [Anaerolineales bacterium]|nr:methyltransferase domain-containing protein [Anaerolineales bacterium]
MSAELFDANYYRRGCGERPYQREPAWLGFFGGVADQLVQRITPPTVLDAGCAMGFLVEALRDRGVAAEGLDISVYAISQVREDIRPYCRVGSVLEPLPRRYALITCIEVLEHMPASAAEAALANLCRHTDDILFSSSPRDYAEPTHFNVQPPEYWAELFAWNGFTRDVDFDASFLTPWAARFRRSAEPPARVVRAYERRFAQLAQENAELRAALNALRHAVQVAEQRLAAQTATPAWAVARTLRAWKTRLAPAGSRRARLLEAVVRATRRRQP